MMVTKITINFQIYYACIVNFITFLIPPKDVLTYNFLFLLAFNPTIY